MTDAVNQSRNSSVVFEENASSDGRSKKRYTKAADKDDMKSVQSGKTSKSGRFEAKYKVGDKTGNGTLVK